MPGPRPEPEDALPQANICLSRRLAELRGGRVSPKELLVAQQIAGKSKITVRLHRLPGSPAAQKCGQAGGPGPARALCVHPWGGRRLCLGSPLAARPGDAGSGALSGTAAARGSGSAGTVWCNRKTPVLDLAGKLRDGLAQKSFVDLAQWGEGLQNALWNGHLAEIKPFPAFELVLQVQGFDADPLQVFFRSLETSAGQRLSTASSV